MKSENAQTTLEIEGMHCAGCVASVEKSLKALPGVAEAVVNLTTRKAAVTFDGNTRVDSDRLVAAVESAGFQAKIPSTSIRLEIQGMTCAGCVAAVEKALAHTEGVESAVVNLATNQARLRYDPNRVTIPDLLKAVEQAGYQAAIEQTETRQELEDRDQAEYRLARDRMWRAWLLSIPVFALMIPKLFLGITWPGHLVHEAVMIIFSAAVIFWPGAATMRSAWRSVAHGGANMDVLIAVGTLASLATGFLSFLMPVASFAMIAAMIMAIHLTGRYLEARARGRASAGIKKLLQLGAKTARLIRRTDNQNGGQQMEELEVPIEQLAIGDWFVVKPGEKIATDGKVVEGESAVDESMISGESMPVAKKAGDSVIGATINQSGRLVIEATRVGQQTFLSQMIRLVEELQTTKVPIQAFADKVTAIFVPTIIVFAIMTFAIWLLFGESLRAIPASLEWLFPWANPAATTLTLAIAAFVSVLVIACPCALGLATPTALMVGSDLGTRHGVLFRHGEAIQVLKDIRAVVFDKTGTLTEGKPQVTDVAAAGQMSEQELLSYAASVEKASEHPLADAIVACAQSRQAPILPVDDFNSLAGQGAFGRVDGGTVLVGSPQMLGERGIEMDGIRDQIESYQSQAKSVVVVSRNRQVLGALAIADAPKTEAKEVITALKRMGIRSVMLTGDNQRTAEAIAAQLGIDRVVANCLPDNKVEEIEKLQQEFGSVAMVGDGINDAPALTSADIGIAMGSGTDIAIESAGVTLVRGKLTDIITAIRLSRATFRKIKQNLFWAFFYNLLAIPLAVLGLLHPIIAEIAMASSSITVVGNANLLRRVKI